MPTRRRSLWPLVVAALVGAPVLYVASFGPACWMSERVNSSRPAISSLYAPLISYVLDEATFEMSTVQDALYHHSRLGARKGMIPVKGLNGIHWIRCPGD